jgi:hypothetical protein
MRLRTAVSRGFLGIRHDVSCRYDTATIPRHIKQVAVNHRPTIGNDAPPTHRFPATSPPSPPHPKPLSERRGAYQGPGDEVETHGDEG